ncbi:ImuA family protein [Algihabitans albus]|uniref:ImuA family protein n=1 Tax=Algihabitans albus TaxID=2164067 RepID=UPI0013C2ABDD|nr:damage-inducible protein [Algihabitans albus]
MAALDERLPGGGLATTGLHEILPARREWDEGAALGFALVLLGRLTARRDGAILWATRQADLYAPTLSDFGVAAERLLLTRTGGDGETLWALEEGLRCPDLAAVVGEVSELDATAARRLQLAAEMIQRPCLLLQRQRLAPRRATAASPALTRWRVEARAGDPSLPKGLVGNPVWRVELLRCRGGQPAVFEVEWDHATSDFALAAELCDSTTATFGYGA